MAGLKSRRFARTFALICALTIGLYTALHYCFPQRSSTLKAGVEEMDRLCSQLTNDCYIVKQKVGENLEIHRTIESEKYSRNGQYVLTFVPMTIDSSGATVINRKTVTSCYIASFIAFPYVSGALAIDQPANVLSIGLGGAGFDMFLYTNERKLNITVVELDEAMVEMARRWFEIAEDERRRTVVADGVQFLREAADRGEKYDVIALDACDNSNAAYMCPALVFYSAETMKNIHDCITDRGILVINVITGNITALATAARAIFPTCYIAQMPNPNIVLACVKYTVASEDPTRHVRFGIFAAKFGLDQLIGNVVFKQF